VWVRLSGGRGLQLIERGDSVGDHLTVHIRRERVANHIALTLSDDSADVP
jgi:hypothetical protein